jgi:hypothetical protein
MNLFHSVCGNVLSFRVRVFCTSGRNFGIGPDGITKLNLAVTTSKPELIVWDCNHCMQENLDFSEMQICCSICAELVSVENAISTLYFPVLCKTCEGVAKSIAKGADIDMPPDRLAALQAINMPERAKRIPITTILKQIYQS